MTTHAKSGESYGLAFKHDFHERISPASIVKLVAFHVGHICPNSHPMTIKMLKVSDPIPACVHCSQRPVALRESWTLWTPISAQLGDRGDLETFFLLLFSREWMGMGVAGIIVHSYYGSFRHSRSEAPASFWGVNGCQ